MKHFFKHLELLNTSPNPSALPSPFINIYLSPFIGLFILLGKLFLTLVAESTKPSELQRVFINLSLFLSPVLPLCAQFFFLNVPCHIRDPPRHPVLMDTDRLLLSDPGLEIMIYYILIPTDPGLEIMIYYILIPTDPGLEIMIYYILIPTDPGLEIMIYYILIPTVETHVSLNGNESLDYKLHVQTPSSTQCCKMGSVSNPFEYTNIFINPFILRIPLAIIVCYSHTFEK